MLCRTALLLGLAAGLAAAATPDPVDEVVAAVRAGIPAEELAQPGSTVLAERLAAAEGEDKDLPEAQRQALRLRIAEAWLGAGKADLAEALARAVLTAKPAAPLLESAALVLVSAWARQPSVRPPAGGAAPATGGMPEDPEAALQAIVPVPSPIVARVLVSLARIRMADKDAQGAMRSLDRALELLAQADAYARVPVYELRLLAFEQSGADAAAVQAWLDSRRGDPAIEHLMDTLLTGSQRLVGQRAPSLAGPRSDGGKVSLAEFAGRPVLVYFFATWAQACDEATAAVVSLAKAEGAPAVIGVSLDTKETLPRIAAWRDRNGATFPVLAEGHGWDSELDDAWHVTAIPALVLVGAGGAVVANDLVGRDADDTRRRVTAALSTPARPAAEPVRPPAGEEIIP